MVQCAHRWAGGRRHYPLDLEDRPPDEQDMPGVDRCGMSRALPAPPAPFLKVACIGDSLTACGYPRHLGDRLGTGFHVRDCGVSGATVTRWVPFAQPYFHSPEFQAALAFDADIFVVLLGTNDSKAQVWCGETHFKSDYTALVQQLVESGFPGRQPRVLLVVPPPLGADGVCDGMQQKVVNTVLPRAVRKIAGDLGLQVVDAFTALGGTSFAMPSAFYEDLCHLRQSGDELLAGHIEDALRSAWTPTEMAGG